MNLNVLKATPQNVDENSVRNIGEVCCSELVLAFANHEPILKLRAVRVLRGLNITLPAENGVLILMLGLKGSTSQNVSLMVSPDTREAVESILAEVVVEHSHVKIETEITFLDENNTTVATASTSITMATGNMVASYLDFAPYMAAMKEKYNVTMSQEIQPDYLPSPQ